MAYIALDKRYFYYFSTKEYVLVLSEALVPTFWWKNDTNINNLVKMTHSRTSMARTSVGLWEFVLAMGSSSF